MPTKAALAEQVLRRMNIVGVGEVIEPNVSAATNTAIDSAFSRLQTDSLTPWGSTVEAITAAYQQPFVDIVAADLVDEFELDPQVAIRVISRGQDGLSRLAYLTERSLDALEPLEISSY